MAKAKAKRQNAICVNAGGDDYLVYSHLSPGEARRKLAELKREAEPGQHYFLIPQSRVRALFGNARPLADIEEDLNREDDWFRYGPGDPRDGYT